MNFNSTLTVRLLVYVFIGNVCCNFVGWFVCLSLFDFTNFTRDSQEI